MHLSQVSIIYLPADNDGAGEDIVFVEATRVFGNQLNQLFLCENVFPSREVFGKLRSCDLRVLIYESDENRSGSEARLFDREILEFNEGI